MHSTPNKVCSLDYFSSLRWIAYDARQEEGEEWEGRFWGKGTTHNRKIVFEWQVRSSPLMVLNWLKWHATPFIQNGIKSTQMVLKEVACNTVQDGSNGVQVRSSPFQWHSSIQLR